MAENPGNQTPPTDPKSQDKTGPVRPPVLEGTARPTTAGSKPAEPAAASKPEPAKPSAPPQPAKLETEKSGNASWLAGLVGGALGLGAAYGLAWFGLWPVPPQSPPPADPRLAQFATAIPDLQTRSGSLQNELSTLATRLSALEADLAALPAETSDPDLAGEVSALAARLDALAAAAPAPDTTTEQNNAAALAAFETQLARLRQEDSDIAARLTEAEGRIAALSSASEEAVDNRQARMPLILSGLESAFVSGRAYETELTALRNAWPEAPVPQALTASAASGLPRPDDVARRLNAAIPDILAGRPLDGEANWQDGAVDWVRGMIAIRPVGEIEGDGPEALVARLEAAMARRDFVAARDALAALPDPMRDAAAPVAADIALLAAAEAFLADLRQAALSPESGS